MIFKSHKLFISLLVVFIFIFFIFVDSIFAACANIISIYYPAGCESVCFPEEEGCIECNSYEGCIGENGEPPANYDGYCYEISCACPDGKLISYLQHCDDVISSSCGDDICDQNESCSSCSEDCGTCESQTCGDNLCTGFESCLTCNEDCGICEVESGSWWQVKGGLVGSNLSDGLAIESNIPIYACQPPDCDPSLMSTDRTGADDSVGYVLTMGGSLKVNGGVTSGDTNIFSVGTGQTRFYEYFEFFFRQTDFGLLPIDDFLTTYADARKPNHSATKTEYYRKGNLTIQTPWHVYSGEQYVIFVEGNLYLRDGDGASDQLIQVDQNGFIAFIVSGDIIFEESLGNSTLTNTDSNVEGVFIANGQIILESRGVSGGGDDRFVGEGTFVGWNGIILNRDFDDGLGRAEENEDKPVEQFIYRPDFVINLPQVLRSSPTLWQQRL